MKTLRISVDQISEYSFLEFGERGENAVTEVILDFSAWVEEFGEGIVNLYVKRGGDTSAYPVPLSVEGTVATWIVSDTDTYKRGRGEAEYVYVVGEKVEKTAVFGFYVNRDIGQPSTTPPSPYETWLDTLMELSNTTLQNAQDAEESAEKAETASKHYPVIVDNYWWVWRVEEEAYVNSGVKAEGSDFQIKGTVASVADLPSDASQGDFWNVGTHEPYTMYMYQVGAGWINQGTLRGPTGATFTPSVNEDGIISWTNDGELPNPAPRNIRGPQGIQGVKGDTGDAAGFGQPTAAADQTIGQAAVSVSASGPDTAKVFHFSFSGIKGEQGIQGNKGDTGDAAGFGQPTASVDANVGIPSVTVTSSGPDTAKVFDFQFRNMKGNKGDTGNGISAVSLISTSGLDKTYRITFTESSPFDFVVHDGRGISSVVLNADYTLTLNFTDGTSFTTTSIRGEKGEKGDTGEPGKNFTIEDYVATPADLPSGVAVGTVYGVGTSEPYDVYIYSRSQGWVNNGTIQGPRGLPGDNGTTFTPAVSSAGVISWTNDGGLPNPDPVNIKGAKGDNGDAAGFGTPVASVDANVGTPSVTVSASGPDTAKVFNFQFKNLKGVQGAKGDDGDTGTTFTPSVSAAGEISWTNDGGKQNPPSVNIKGPQGNPGVSAGFGTPTASVDANVGTPAVTITASGPDTSKVFDFRFENLKGQKGDKGDTGEDGAPGVSAGFGTPTASASQTTGTPVVTVTASGPNTAKVFDFQFSGIKGETGGTGTTFTPSVSSEGVISWTNDGGKTNPQSVNIRGPQGIQGETGNPGASAGFGTPSATVGTGTGTPSVTVIASGPDTAKVFAFAFDGLKGTPGTNGEGVPTGGTAGQFLKKSSGTDFDSKWADVEIPTKVSDLTNDAGYITGMEILSYGNSTFADFLAAYTAKKVVYCRASSNSNPATGSQTRLAFMAYVNNADNPTEVEFQYYRSVSAHTASQQGDQVYVYKLTKTAGWTVTTREASSKVVAGTNMTSSYSNDTITLNANTPTKDTVGLGNVDNVQQYSATNPPPYPVTSVNGSTGAVTVPTYESKAAASGGTDVSLVTTGEKYSWNTKELPSGGAVGQVLKKKSANNYDTEWADESGGGFTYIIEAHEANGDVLDAPVGPNFEIACTNDDRSSYNGGLLDYFITTDGGFQNRVVFYYGHHMGDCTPPNDKLGIYTLTHYAYNMIEGGDPDYSLFLEYVDSGKVDDMRRLEMQFTQLVLINGNLVARTFNIKTYVLYVGNSMWEACEHNPVISENLRVVTYSAISLGAPPSATGVSF